MLSGLAKAVDEARAQEREVARARANEAAAIAAKDKAETARAEAEKRADEAAHSRMVALSASCGVVILLALVAIGLGVYLRSKILVVGAAVVAVVAFLGVLLFAALAWVLAHPFLVGSITISVMALGGVGIWLSHRAGWWRWSSLDGGAKLLLEAIKSNDMNKVKEAMAALRVDSDFEASVQANKT